MPRFFFDTVDDHGFVRDEQGSELTGIDRVEAEALETLPEMALHRRYDSASYQIAIHVRDEGGRVVLKAKLAMTAERIA